MNGKKSNIAVLILAAGSSKRLGKPKQLVKFKNKTLLQHSIDVSEALDFSEKIIVLGANEEKILNEVDLKNHKLLVNNNWQEGMSTSLKKGLEEIQKLHPAIENVLVLLSDQPFISELVLQELIDKHLKSNCLASFSEYQKIPGVPAIFSREIFPHLLKIEGDRGARDLIKNGLTNYQLVPFEKGIVDIDTEKDLQLLKQLEHEA
ncbi:molybdenum cofactor cytidylyltransferase [Gramella sp. Hel_I_59]|uniref:nucleotidyltransferase family protein n=1 Tax=Gramella sp. Hel_I_59 TaxID=1249978 RepID=UPI001152BC84|nr:nucleotidyltransferase family protein [Gramella sp. Hel_I_59]TQI70478.1 molybdenum cofactor cytidylyltransferase [Gramella sp. Hel_I_59]